MSKKMMLGISLMLVFGGERLLGGFGERIAAFLKGEPKNLDSVKSKLQPKVLRPRRLNVAEADDSTLFSNIESAAQGVPQGGGKKSRGNSNNLSPEQAAKSRQRSRPYSVLGIKPFERPEGPWDR